MTLKFCLILFRYLVKFLYCNFNNSNSKIEYTIKFIILEIQLIWILLKKAL